MEDGRSVPGGPSLYAALTVRGLGAQAVLVTNLAARYDRSVLAGVELVLAGEAEPARYENQYDASGHRSQRLLDEGGEIATASVLAELADRYAAEPPAAILACPAYHEVSGFISSPTGSQVRRTFPTFGAAVVAASLQGPLRERLADGRVEPVTDANTAVAGFAHPGSLLFFSAEDTPQAASLAGTLAAVGAIVALTRGEQGASLYRAEGLHEWPALAATLVEPTGAGDCFAAACAVRYVETGDLAEALRWGLAAGAVAVEAPGLSAVPTRAAVVARLAEAA